MHEGIQAMAKAGRAASDTLSNAVMEKVRKWSEMKQTGVSLRYMMDFGSKPTPKNLLRSAQFLHRELPIRLARRAVELDSLPHGLSQKPPVLKVRSCYLESFREVQSFPEVRDATDEVSFTQMLKLVKARHKNIVPTMAMGVQQLKKELNQVTPPQIPEEIHQFLDRFYMSAIGIRMLIGQHVVLHDPDPQPGCVGMIHCQMSPVNVVRSASEDARAICMREFGTAPNVSICGDSNFTFPYIPTHLHFIMFELVKNSLRAVQEQFMDTDENEPDVRIVVAAGIEDVTIKISDEGGGIARSGLPKIFTYLYPTARNPICEELRTEEATTGVDMARYGCGIPISRLYARYFGGDLQIISMEGYGTDAYLHLSRMGDSEETLP